MTCLDCRNRRRFAGGAVRAPWLLLCYHCYLRRRARLHIASRVALVALSAAFAIALVLTLAGRLWR